MDKTKNILGNNTALSLSRNLLPVEKLHSLSHRPTLGLLHSFSLPDFIEVTRNGGHIITCLENSTLYPFTDNVGLADKIEADRKNRNKFLANRYS